MLAEQILRLYEYNRWANHLILEKAGQLTLEQLSAPSRFPRGSMLETLFHAFYAEWVWRKRIQGQSPLPNDEMIHVEDYATLGHLKSAWQSEEQAMVSYLSGLEGNALEANIHYSNSRGEFDERLSDILMHVVLHGMQHRSELAQMLTELGHSPGDVDYIIYRRNL